MQPKRGSTIRILIVDDSQAILNFVSRALTFTQGIEVIGFASNGTEAVERADELHPDVVVMDVEMPIMDGLEATRRIKRDHPEIVVVLVSGSGDLLAEGVATGVDGYIVKPFSVDSLVCRVMGDFERTDTP